MKGSKRSKASEKKTKPKVEEKKDVCSAKLKKVDEKALCIFNQISDQYIRFLIMRYITLKRHLFRNQVFEPIPLIKPVYDVLEQTMIEKVLKGEQFTDQDIQIDASVFCSSDEDCNNTDDGINFSKDFVQSIENINDIQNKNFDETNKKRKVEDIRICVSSSNTHLDYIPLSKIFRGAVNKKHCKEPITNYNSNETAKNEENCNNSKLCLRGRLLLPIRSTDNENTGIGNQAAVSKSNYAPDSSTESSDISSDEEEFLPKKKYEEHTKKQGSKTFACSICKFNVETIGYDKYHLASCYKRYCLNNKSNNK